MSIRRLPMFAVVAAVFCLVAVHRFDIIDSPPYVEQSAGHWNEADWLAENHFDYYSLRFNELHFEEGGPRAFWCSVFPTIVAMGMRLDLPPKMFFVVYRILLVWLPAALILVLVFGFVREVAKGWIGVCVAICVYVTPIFSVQVEMLGMDVTMTAMAMVWWAAMHRRRFWIACALGAVPFFLKPSAFVIPMGAAAYHGLSALGWFRSRNRQSAEHAALSSINTAVAAAQVLFLIFGGDLKGRVMPFSGLRLWLQSSPDFLFVILATVLVTIVWMRKGISSRSRTTFADSALELLDRNPLLFAGWFVVFLNLAAAMNTYYESRHLTLVVPIVFVLLGRLATDLGWSRSNIGAALVGYTAFSLANANGGYYPKLPSPETRGWGVLERSMEYRVDHESYIAASRVLDESARGVALLASDQFLCFLKLPRLGYVRQRFGDGKHVYIANDANILRIFDEQPESIVVAHLASQFGDWPFPAYVMSDPDFARDEILYNDHLNPPVIIYRRWFDKSKSEAERMRAYSDLLFSDAAGVDPGVRLAVIGDEKLALRYIRADLKTEIGGAAVKQELIRRVREYLRVLDAELTDPNDFTGWRLRGTVQMRLDDLIAGRLLSPLPWSRRTFYDTWPQRWQYFSAAETALREVEARKDKSPIVGHSVEGPRP